MDPRLDKITLLGSLDLLQYVQLCKVFTEFYDICQHYNKSLKIKVILNSGFSMIELRTFGYTGKDIDPFDTRSFIFDNTGDFETIDSLFRIFYKYYKYIKEL